MARRRIRIPKFVDRIAVVFIWSGITWIVLTSHFVNFPHSIAMLTSLFVAGIVGGHYLRKLRIVRKLRRFPIRVTVTIGSAARRRGQRQ